MQRRRLLQLGLGGVAVLAVAGAGLAWLDPGLRQGRLTPRARELFTAIGGVLLDGSLPEAPPARQAALQGLVDRLAPTIAALAPAARKELAQLLSLLLSAPGRRTLAGLAADWPVATPGELHDALDEMRLSSLLLRRQAYQALHELSYAAYFADPSSWAAIGYPGPTDI